MASVFEQSGLSIHCQLRVTFSMLPTKNYKHTFKFAEVINRNTLSVFHLGYNKNGIFDHVIITSSLRTDMAI